MLILSMQRGRYIRSCSLLMGAICEVRCDALGDELSDLVGLSEAQDGMIV
jgi:hypothetical protein